MASQADHLQNWTIPRFRSPGLEHSAEDEESHQKKDCNRSDEAPRTQSTLLELLTSCIHAREEGWNEFIERFQRLIAIVIIKTLRRYTNPSPSTIDDLVQETYLKLCDNNFKALREFDCCHERALAGFLKVVASNVAQDYLRSSLCQKRGSGKGEDTLEEAILWKVCAVRPAESMDRGIVLRQVQQCLERELSEPHLARDCKIFWLYYRDGLTAKAIARRADIGLSVKGVESALFRVTQLVRTKLGKRKRHGRRSRASAA